MEVSEKQNKRSKAWRQSRVILPKFLRLKKQQPALQSVPPKFVPQDESKLCFGGVFAVWYFIVSTFRMSLSFVTGGTECAVCGNISFVVPVCRKCSPVFSVRKAIGVSGTRCSRCGKTLVSEKGTCLRCRSEKCFLHADSVFALYSYRLWHKNIVFLWKKQGVRPLADFFAARVLYVLRALGKNIVVPVPPRHGKIFSVGWDQIEDICFLLEKSGVQVWRVLERVSEVEQKKLDREGRLAVVSSAYRAKDSALIAKEENRNGSKLPSEACIFDDVITTGATVESCAIALKKIGVQKITALSLFMVD